MNLFKKEEKRKREEARRGLSKEEIAELDAQEALHEEIIKENKMTLKKLIDEFGAAMMHFGMVSSAGLGKKEIRDAFDKVQNVYKTLLVKINKESEKRRKKMKKIPIDPVKHYNSSYCEKHNIWWSRKSNQVCPDCLMERPAVSEDDAQGLPESNHGPEM